LKVEGSPSAALLLYVVTTTAESIRRECWVAALENAMRGHMTEGQAFVA